MDRGEVYRKLNKTLLINWFNFNHTLMDWGEINHLTGENRSGKTTIIDAIYMVMNADIKGRYFNAAAREATGRRQKRDLKGYMCKLINTDSSGNKIYERDKANFNSYVALEWIDMKENKPFIMGFVGEYNARRGEINHRWFLISGITIKGMEEFTNKETHTPYTISELKAKFQILNSYGNCSCDLFERMEDYLRSRLARLGSPNVKYFELFSKAISFRDMNIQEFIRSYICDEEEDTLKVESLEGIINEYDRLAKLSRQYKTKNDLLSAEKALNDAYLEAKERRCTLQYIKAKLLLHREEVNQDERLATLESSKERQAKLEEQSVENDEERIALDKEYEELVYREKNNSNSARIASLEEKKKELALEIEKIRSEVNRTLNEGRAFGSAWVKSVKTLRDNGISDFSGEDGENALSLSSLEISSVYDFAFKTAAEAYSRYCDDISEKFYQVSASYREAKEEDVALAILLEKLNSGIFPFPDYIKEAKERLSDELECDVFTLAECVEDIDHSIASRVEAFLGDRRFAFIVPEGSQEVAKSILKKINANGNLYIVESKGEVKNTPFNSLLKVSNPKALSYLASILPLDLIKSDAFSFEDAYLKLSSPLDRFLGREALEEQKREAEEKRALLLYRLRELEKKNYALSVAKQSFKDRGTLSVIVSKLPELIDRENEYSDNLTNIASELDDLFRDPELNDIIKEKEENKVAKNQNRLDRDKINIEIGKVNSNIENLNRAIPEFEKKIKLLEEDVTSLSASLSEEALTKADDNLSKWKYRGDEGLTELEKNVSRARDEELSADKGRRSKRYEFIESCNAADMRVHLEDDEPFITYCKMDGVDFAKAEERFKKDEESARQNFQSEVLAQMSSTFERMGERISNINKAIPRQYHYRFVMRQKKDFVSIFEMIKDSEIKMVSPEASLFNDIIFSRYEQTIKNLIALLRSSMGNNATSAINYRDCRNYFDFDLMYTDDAGNEQSLTNLIGIKSGGETQEPLYIALFASIAQACHVNIQSANDTVRLVVFDEAFSKMDRTRIHRCLQLITQFHLQAIFLTPPEKIREVNSAGLGITTNIVITPPADSSSGSTVLRSTGVAFNQMRNDAKE